MNDRAPQRPVRILFVPLLFVAEPWNGIMEHLRILATGIPTDLFEPMLAVRPSDGEQTTTLAERAHLPVVGLPSTLGVRNLVRVFRDHSIDVVHVHTPVTAGVPHVVVAARLARCRVIVTYHQVQPARLPARTRAINRGVHRLVAATIAVSGGVAGTLGEHAGLERRRIGVIHNGVEPYEEETADRVRAPSGDCTFGYFGRLAEEKDVATLVRATEVLARDAVAARAIIVGDGYERVALERLAGELRVMDRVSFLGFRSDARALMRAVDVVIHPPRFEGFGLSLIEAMEASKPIVATRVIGGITELVREGVNGLLVPPGDASALASAMQTLVDDPYMRRRLGANGRRMYDERFRSDVMVRAILDLYREVASVPARQSVEV